MRTEEMHGERHIEVFADASTIAGWRKQALAGQKDTRSFTIVADEGDYLPGGEGTAPTPLTYFVAGMALCILAQVSQVALRRKLAIRNERVRVSAHFLESGSILKGDKAGAAQRFQVELALDSDESEEDVAALMRQAHAMCFAEDSIARAIEIETRHVLNGRQFPI